MNLEFVQSLDWCEEELVQLQARCQKLGFILSSHSTRETKHLFWMQAEENQPECSAQVVENWVLMAPPCLKWWSRLRLLQRLGFSLNCMSWSYRAITKSCGVEIWLDFGSGERISGRTRSALLSVSLFMGLVLKFHSVGTSPMRILDFLNDSLCPSLILAWRSEDLENRTRRTASGFCGKNMLDVHVIPRCVMSARQRSRPETNGSTSCMLLHGNLFFFFFFQHEVCYAEVLFQPSFYSGRVHVACRT